MEINDVDVSVQCHCQSPIDEGKDDVSEKKLRQIRQINIQPNIRVDAVRQKVVTVVSFVILRRKQ